MSKLPLEGIRIADATNSWAGPYATGLMASFGAEVIKIETIQRLEPWRTTGTRMEEPLRWEKSPSWNAVNAGKLGITLDLTRPEGAEVFKKLVKISDIVAENFTPRVMANFGLDYSVLKQVNPGIIMVSLPAHGATGPWRDYPGYAMSIEEMAGICQLTGYPDGPPMSTNWGFSDPVGGVNGMVAIMFALLHRQTTGEGQYIDLSQIETETCLIGEAIIDYTMNGRVQTRLGNHHPFMAPHGFYRSKGNDLWVGIAISSDEEWKRFVEAIGNPPWTKEEKFADSLSRWKNQTELDKLIEEWTVLHSPYETMDILQKAGVAAGAVITSAELLTDPHLKARGIYHEVDRSVIGKHPYPIASAPQRLSKSPVTIRRPAPLLGEHNDYVLGELLGISKEEIKSLAEKQIIGNAPVGTTPR